MAEEEMIVVIMVEKEEESLIHDIVKRIRRVEILEMKKEEATKGGVLFIKKIKEDLTRGVEVIDLTVQNRTVIVLKGNHLINHV